LNNHVPADDDRGTSQIGTHNLAAAHKERLGDLFETPEPKERIIEVHTTHTSCSLLLLLVNCHLYLKLIAAVAILNFFLHCASGVLFAGCVLVGKM